MRWLLNPCRRYRRNLALLAARVLPESERNRIEAHLIACASCRAQLAELKLTTVSLTRWAAGTPAIHPGVDAKLRWAAAIHAAAVPRPGSPAPAAANVNSWWTDVIWSSRRVWTGLAAVWLLIGAGNWAMRDQPHAVARRSSPTAREMIMAYKEQQTILNELLADHSGPREAERPRFSPKPRTERLAGCTA